MPVLVAILSALALLWSSSSLATERGGVLCRGGEERALRAAAHTYDAEDSLQYAQQRWLDPTTGRFLSLDPVQGVLSDPLTTQGFTYVSANPTRFTDPDGRCQFALDEEGLPKADCIGDAAQWNGRLRDENISAAREGRYGALIAGSVLQVAFAPVLLAGVAAEAVVALPFNIGSGVTSLHNSPTPDKVERLVVEVAKAAIVAADPAMIAARMDATIAAQSIGQTAKSSLTMESVEARTWTTSTKVEALEAGETIGAARLRAADIGQLESAPARLKELLKDVNPTKCRDNCGNSSITFDRRAATGAMSSAVPSGVQRRIVIAEYAESIGRSGMAVPGTPESIRRSLAMLPNETRAIITGKFTSGPQKGLGHAFNATKIDGSVYFVDPQVGRVMTPKDFTEMDSFTYTVTSVGGQ